MGGIIRILKSSKGVAALSAIAGIVLVQVLRLEPEMAKTLTTGILALAALYIGGVAVEDAGKGIGNGIANGKKEDDA